jgi:hypothetical protein
VARRLPDLERAVTAGEVPAAAAARELLALFLGQAPGRGAGADDAA